MIMKLKPTACLAAAAALGNAAAVDRLAATTAQAHVFCVHLLLCPLQYTPHQLRPGGWGGRAGMTVEMELTGC